jgi:tetratricopeptide (TPR) repeat protein
LSGSANFCARQYDRAIVHYRKALELNPQYTAPQIFLGYSLILAGKLNDGIRACEIAVSLWGRHPMSLGFLGSAYALAGRNDEAHKLVEELYGLAEQTYVSGISFALIYSSLGEIDKTLDWIERAIEERDAPTAMFLNMPLFDPLRSHPRYHALMRKMNLEP